MRWFRFAALTLVITILQASLINSMPINPNLLVVLMVFFAIFADSKEAIITSFSIGLAADLIGPGMGTLILSFGLTGSLLAYLNRTVAIRKMTLQAAAIFVVSITIAFAAHFLIMIKSQITPENIYTSVIAPAIYSGIIGPFLFLPIAWLMKIKHHGFSGH